MVILKRKMTTICEIVLNALFILLSATIVFMQLVVVTPRLLKLVPFYRKAIHAVDKMFELEDEEEFDSLGGTVKAKLKVGNVKKGEIGFSELLKVIEAHQSIPSGQVKRIGLAWGVLPIKTPQLSPNYVVFIEEQDGATPIIFNPFDPNESSIKRLLVDWVRSIVQTRMAIYTAIIVVVWVAVMTLVVYG